MSRYVSPSNRWIQARYRGDLDDRVVSDLIVQVSRAILNVKGSDVKAGLTQISEQLLDLLEHIERENSG